jgi:hypothetical protein
VGADVVPVQVPLEHLRAADEAGGRGLGAREGRR